MTSHTLRLGTRGSELALKQAEMVEAALRAAHPSLEVERVVIATTGDKRPDLRFKEFTDGDRLDKGIFTKELELALEDKRIDFAVHSLKDVPTVLDDQFLIAATLERAPIEDVLITREAFTLQTLPKGARIGTSSVRRIRQIKWIRPDLECVEIRGNVPTRIRKLQNGDLDAILLARAGLVRLNLLQGHTIVLEELRLPAQILPCETFLPAAGQGAIGIEARRDDSVTLPYLAAINHAHTFARVSVEREFLHLLKAGCQTPIGAHTSIEGDSIHFKAWVFDEADEAAPPRELETSASLAQPLQAAIDAASGLAD